MTEAKARLLVYARSGGICERCSQARRPVLVQNLSRWVYLDAYGDYVDFPPAVSA
jgi:hypothetical protein